MKLVRISAFAFVALSAACASRPAAPAAAPAAPDAVSTTRVNAAVFEEDATPRVGKAQRSDDASQDDSLSAPKDEPRRSEGRRSWK